MKLLGVTGKTGAGKTTFSNMLAENQGIDVIHIDDILKNIKLKYFKLLMREDKNGEKTKINSKLKAFLYKNKLVFELFMRFRARLIKKPLLCEIEKLQQEKNEIIIIDDIFIRYNTMYKELSEIYIIERSYANRQEGVKQRDNLSKEEMVAADTAHYTGNYKEISQRKNIQKIINNGTQDELRAKAKQIYCENFTNFKTKYKVNDSKEPNSIINEENINNILKNETYKGELNDDEFYR